MRPHLATLLDDFRRNASQLAVVTHRGNRRFPATYGQLAELSARFAGELERRGLRAGDRLLIWGDNSVEWVAAFFGCVLRGVLAVPLDVASGTEFARRVASEVQPRLMTGNPALLGRLGSSIPVLGFSSFLGSLPEPLYAPLPGLSRETILQIVFTSGTTAEPKGIVHTHGNVLASIDPLEEELRKYLRYERWVHPLRILHTLPLSHVFGQFMGLWVPPLLTAEVHFESRAEASRLIRTIHQERISVLAAVPRVLDLLRTSLVAEMPELPALLAASREVPVWKRWWRFRRLHRRFGMKFWALVCGGAAVSAELEDFWTTAAFAVIQGYGMTETTALVTLNHPFKRAQGSIGRPLRGREVQIGPDGEILVRGASIAEQIWQQGRMQQRPEGWLATGDLAARDARGELVFAGRKSDVIVTAAGLNLYPQDLEAALQKQTAVREAIVVPYASSAGPMPVAVLRPQPPPARLDAQAAVGAANRDLAPHQQILYSLVWPAPDFPRTSTGKVLRKQVAAWVQRSLDGEKTDGGETALEKLSPLPADPLLNLLHQLQPETRHRQISREDRLAEDLHLDSLAMVQLQSSLETSFGIELDDAAWQGIKTVGELRRLLNPAEVSSAAPEARPPAAPAPHEISLPEPVPSAAIPVPFAAPLAKPPQEIYPRWPWWSPVRFMRTAFLELILRPLVWLLLAPEVKGQRHLPRPSLIIANHVTALDAAILLYALRPRDRDRVAIAMAGQILGGWRRGKAQKHGAIRLLTPLAYWLVTALFNVFPLPKGAGVRASFAHAGAALDRGYHVLVFPEGGRSPDGRLQPFQSGIGLLAQESEAPVQPVYLAGLGPLKLGQRSWFRPGSVAIRLGEPLEMNEEETPAQFTERLRAALAQLGETE